MADNPMIYGLIQKAMGMIGAIGKDSVNEQQKFRYRGIDAVYNALNPVMSELGLFICPEIIDHKREERRKIKEYGGKQQESVLLYSILTIKYTMYAPDGSNVSCVVVGEGMDSGDKASNKAMSIALKYACFQLFMIPTEEMVDPDAEVHEVQPKGQPQAKPQTPPKAPAKPQSVQVTTTATVPAATQQKPAQAPKITQPPQPAMSPVMEYLAKEREELRQAREMDKAENTELWNKQLSILKANKIVPDKPLSQYTQKEATLLVNMMYARFDPHGTELKPYDGDVA